MEQAQARTLQIKVEKTLNRNAMKAETKHKNCCVLLKLYRVCAKRRGEVF